MSAFKKDCLKKQLQFRFANALDRILIVIGVICSSIHGATLPLMIVVFGEMTDSLINDGAVTNWWNDLGKQLAYNASCYYNQCQNVSFDDVNTAIANIT